MLLAGDVGGTKTRLALYEEGDRSLKRLFEERFESAKFSSLEDILRNFLEKNSAKARVACFGIPGPVIKGRVKVTNLPWELGEDTIAKALDIPRVKLVNDLVATAAAIPAFAASDLLTLHTGSPREGDGVAAVIAPGTGLGQAFLIEEDGRYSFLPSEGGHANFAPGNALEFELHSYVEKKYGHASIERVLCGPGLVNIYEFLRDSGKADEPADLKQAIQQGMPAAVITSSALEAKHEITVKTLEVFVSILGAHASNIMITLLAAKGIYLGGGVPPKITAKLKDGQILKTYLAKGKMADQVKAAPLHVIKDDHAALTGAARIAQSLI